MLIALVRHGETDWNAEGRIQGSTDIPLNANGMKQAARAAWWVSGNGRWGRLYSSPLTRARQTAELISLATGLEVTVRPDLAERSCGELEGLTSAEREIAFPRRHEDETTVPGLELWEDFRARVRNSFTEVVRESMGQDAIVVSHGAWINQLLHQLSGGRIGTGITSLKNACICLLRSEDDGGWSVADFNYTGHLDILGSVVES